MSWAIRIPVRDPAAPLADVALDAGVLDDEEDRRVVRELVLQAALGGCRSGADLLDRVAAATAGERRRLFDDAREAAGLERSEDIDDAERFARVQDDARRSSSGRDASGAALQGCAAADCAALPCGTDGLLTPVPDRRWWCPEHRDQAGPLDHLPPDDVATIGPNMALIPAPSVVAAMRARDDRARETREHEAAGRRAEGERLAELERARDERSGAELFGGQR